jgi:hypothetical protein
LRKYLCLSVNLHAGVLMFTLLRKYLRFNMYTLTCVDIYRHMLADVHLKPAYLLGVVYTCCPKNRQYELTPIPNRQDNCTLTAKDESKQFKRQQGIIKCEIITTNMLAHIDKTLNVTP